MATLWVSLSRCPWPSKSVSGRSHFFFFLFRSRVWADTLIEVGKNLQSLWPAFLNLMGQIRHRAGHVVVRLGGNSQERATLVTKTSDGSILEKDTEDTNNPTDTPKISYTTGLFDVMAKVSGMAGVGWYLGEPHSALSSYQRCSCCHRYPIRPHLQPGHREGSTPYSWW
jgi:hypothetical protein